MVQVVAGIMERDGRVLICQRTPHQSHPLKWEFPGGKVEPGEFPEQALAREFEEELGIPDAIGKEIARYEFTYPTKNAIVLIFFLVTHWAGEPVNLIFNQMLWERPDRLLSFDFVEGDLPFLRQLAAGRITIA